jgi:hypothetical protein
VFRKSEWPKVPTTAIGYAAATLVGAALTLVLWFFVFFFGLSMGWLSFLEAPDAEPSWLRRHMFLVLSACAVVGTVGSIMMYRLGRGRMAS